MTGEKFNKSLHFLLCRVSTVHRGLYIFVVEVFLVPNGDSRSMGLLPGVDPKIDVTFIRKKPNDSDKECLRWLLNTMVQ